MAQTDGGSLGIGKHVKVTWLTEKEPKRSVLILVLISFLPLVPFIPDPFSAPEWSDATDCVLGLGEKAVPTTGRRVFLAFRLRNSLYLL